MSVNLFDANFYRAANSDLAGLNNAQAFQHLQSFGLNEGRRFSAFADLNFYRASNPDLASAGLTSNAQLFNHLQNSGVAEGRRFSTFADVDFYLGVNQDVNQAFGGNQEAAFNHLRSNGVNEGRLFSAFVDLNYYLRNNSDVAQTVSNNRLFALDHLVLRGLSEGREFSPFVDLDAYRELNSDLKTAFGSNRERLLRHLEINGLFESRQFSQFVDVSYYLANNADVNQAFGGDRNAAFNHLVSTGLNEGRVFTPTYNSSFYRSANPDLASAGLTTNAQAFQHYIARGYEEDRQSIPDPGSTLGNATNIGSLNIAAFPAPTKAKEFLFNGKINNTSDEFDVYRFTLSQTSAVYAQVGFLSADADIAILDSSGNTIISSASSGIGADVVFRTLNAGTYYAQVQGLASTTNYTFDIKAFPVASGDLGVQTRTDPNIFFVNPNNGKLVIQNLVIQNSVNSTASNDFYRLDLVTTTTLSASLFPTSANVDIRLLSLDGSVRRISNTSGTTPDTIVETLEAQTYFVQVYSVAGSSSSYTLQLNFG